MVKAKKFSAIILSIVMLMSIFQLNAFAAAQEQASASVNFTVTRPTIGATAGSCRVSSSTALYPVYGYEWLEAGPSDTQYHQMSSASTFKSGYKYRIHIVFDLNGPTAYPDVTVNGYTPTSVSGQHVLYDFGTLGGSSSGGSSSGSAGFGIGDFFLLLIDIPLEILYFLFKVITFPFALIFGGI